MRAGINDTRIYIRGSLFLISGSPSTSRQNAFSSSFFTLLISIILILFYSVMLCLTLCPPTIYRTLERERESPLSARRGSAEPIATTFIHSRLKNRSRALLFCALGPRGCRWCNVVLCRCVRCAWVYRNCCC